MVFFFNVNKFRIKLHTKNNDKIFNHRYNSKKYSLVIDIEVQSNRNK